jgi:acetolactate synthase-1/2/3 large subunit
MGISGARLLVEALEYEGVEHIFGIIGGVVIPIYDELKESKIKVIYTRHEQGATHMADGYARATGKTGVVLVTSGPGALNTVTGIATAYMDSVPLVVITGQVPTFAIGSDAFQETDATGVTRPITKHNYLIKDIKEIPRVVREAFHIASTGRPGPVLIDIPVDISKGIFEGEFEPIKEVQIRGYKPKYKGHPLQIKKALNLIKESKKPILYIGGGAIISGASEEVKEFVEKTRIPFTTTLLGLGILPSNHPLNLGMLGMHGTRYANLSITECDLIIAVGARFDDRVTGKVNEFAPNAKIIHIDIDPASISKNIDVDVPIVGDVKEVLREINKQIEKPEITQWVNYVLRLKKENPLKYIKSDNVIKPQFVVEKVSELVPDDTIIATDVGQHQMWVAQFYKFRKPRTLLTSGGLGTMGYGVPAGIGAWIGHPDRTVFVFSGDGSFQMNMQELATAVQYRIPVKIGIMNNAYLGMVRQWQQLFYNRRYMAVDLEIQPDFPMLAKSFGAVGIAVEKPSEVESAIKEALSIKDRPVVIDFRIAREENVFPMVPAGGSVKEMLMGESELA